MEDNQPKLENLNTTIPRTKNDEVFLTMLVETGLVDIPVEDRLKQCQGMKVKIDQVPLLQYLYLSEAQF